MTPTATEITELLLSELAREVGADLRALASFQSFEELGLDAERLLQMVRSIVDELPGQMVSPSSAVLARISRPEQSIAEVAVGLSTALRRAQATRVHAAAKPAPRDGRERTPSGHLALRDATGDSVKPSLPKPFKAIRKRVLFATDRRSRQHQRLGLTYTGGRDQLLSYGECEVSVPTERLLGSLPTTHRLMPWLTPVEGEHFILASLESLIPRDFFARARKRADEFLRREAFVFVHGYNTSFEAAVLRTAQLAVDLRLEGAPILYSWPARGDALKYKHDEASIEATADRFRIFLCDLAASGSVERINILAHSMGSRALCDALRILGHAGRSPTDTKIANVVFAAPDVDADAYRNMSDALTKPSAGTTLYASAKDRALRLSRRLSGAPRAGQPLVIARGVDTIDASDVSTSFFEHGYFAKGDAVLHDLFELFSGLPAAKRFRLEPRTAPEGPYFYFRA